MEGRKDWNLGLRLVVSSHGVFLEIEEEISGCRFYYGGGCIQDSRSSRGIQIRIRGMSRYEKGMERCDCAQKMMKRMS